MQWFEKSESDDIEGSTPGAATKATLVFRGGGGFFYEYLHVLMLSVSW